MRTHDTRVWGHTRWRRLVLVLLPTVVVSAVLGAFVVAGVLPAAIAVSTRSVMLSGQDLKISADRLEGRGFTQYAAADRTGSGAVPEGLSGVQSADLYNLCQSVLVSMPVLGKATLLIKAGSDGRPAHADNLVVHTDDLGGDAVFSNLIIGQDAATLPGATGAPSGAFGQHSDALRIDHLKQQARGVSAATFRLTGLHLRVERGDHSCY